MEKKIIATMNMTTSDGETGVFELTEDTLSFIIDALKGKPKKRYSPPQQEDNERLLEYLYRVKKAASGLKFK